MTNATQSGNRYGVAPNAETVDMLMDRLVSDPDFVIEVMVNNRYAEVSRRFTVATGKVATTPVDLAKELKRMRKAGGLERKKVRYCIAVPYEQRGNTALDVAVAALRSEWTAMQDNVQQALASKSSRDLFEDEEIDWWVPPPGADPQAPQTDTGRNNEFWNSLPGILTGLGGLVGAFTGNAPAGAADGAAVPPAQRPATNWMSVVLIGLAIAAVITGSALIYRAYKKK